MSRIELKVTCHIKNQENQLTRENINSQSTDANIERYQILELPKKNFRATIKKMLLQQL